jgi:AcrR family transcriptional regulator
MTASESRETTVVVAEPARVSARERIRDAAEQIFASHGYEGASMRLIAEQAGVAQALLHYHFQNKDTLYEAVFERRSSAINDRRAALLDGLFNRKTQPLLEDVLDILFLPVSPLSGKAKSDYEAFQQIVTAASVSSDHRSKELMTKYYDPIARRFVEAFQKVMPGLSEKSAIWSYLFALGARMQAQSRSKRAVRLSEFKKADDSAAVSAFLAAFVAAGIRAAATHGLPHEAVSKSSRPASRIRIKQPAVGHA